MFGEGFDCSQIVLSNVCDKLNITREEAWALLNEYNKDEFHLEHGEIVEKTMDVIYKPTQMNVAMIGNKTPQLHVHIICRFQGDMYWPGTVWGGRSRPYLSTMKAQTIERLKKEIIWKIF